MPEGRVWEDIYFSRKLRASAEDYKWGSKYAKHAAARKSIVFL